jgi:protein TonB
MLTLGIIPLPERKPSNATIVDLIPEDHSSKTQATQAAAPDRPTPKPPPIILPVKPTIAAPPPKASEHQSPWLEMSSDQMAAADIRNLPKASPGEGDSDVVGKGPHGETLYNAEWVREPTNAELAGYLPKNAHEGKGVIACKTIPGNRVDDCIELGQTPPGSHLASALRQAAWQFKVRPPRKGGKALIGEWVQITLNYGDSG